MGVQVEGFQPVVALGPAHLQLAHHPVDLCAVGTGHLLVPGEVLEEDGLLSRGEGEEVRHRRGGFRLDGGLLWGGGGGGRLLLDRFHFDGLGRALLRLGCFGEDWGLDNPLLLSYGVRSGHGEGRALGQATPLFAVNCLEDEPGVGWGHLL